MAYELSSCEQELVRLAMYLYYFYKGGGRRVLRQGWNLWGIGERFYSTFCEANRLEYVIEHESSCVFLAFLLFELFPGYFYGIKRGETYELLLTHDTGEVVSGDIPDDGNRDEAKKDKEEFAFFEWLFSRKTPFGQNILGFEQLLKNFRNFQTKLSIESRFAYCIDKTDAILQGLVYEYEGFPGNVTYKKVRGRLSARDEETIQITGSSSLVNNWFESCRPNIETADPTGVINFFTNFIKIAISYVRSDEFNPKADLKEYCESRGLPCPYV